MGWTIARGNTWMHRLARLWVWGRPTDIGEPTDAELVWCGAFTTLPLVGWDRLTPEQTASAKYPLIENTVWFKIGPVDINFRVAPAP